MRFDLKLSQKGLILVCFPLVFQIIFVAVLAQLLTSAEREERIAKRGEQIISRVGNASKHLIESEFALIGSIVRRDANMKQLYEYNDSQVPVMFEDLRKLTKDMPETAARVAALERGYNKQRQMIRGAVSGIQGGNLMTSMWTLAAQSTNSYFSTRREIEAITQEVKKSFASDAEEERQKKFIWTVLLTTLIWNIIISILMALYFSKSIAGRLTILSDNATRVKERRALNPLISGTDEIASLDKSFHDMSDALTKAEQAKAEFISMISHDLRSPLTSLQFTLALAEKGAFGDLNEKGKERFSRAEDTVQRLVKLINELLDIERLEAGMLNMELELEELDPIVSRAIDSVNTLAERKGIEFDAPDTAFKVMADADRLVQVLVNLLSNAIKFSPQNSKISITAAELPTGVKVTVTDQGRGIPKEKIAAIFDRFQQVSQEDSTTHGGTGLGLAIVKAIIEGHGGFIGVDSEEGSGSRFWFIVQKADSNS